MTRLETLRVAQVEDDYTGLSSGSGDGRSGHMWDPEKVIAVGHGVE